MYKNVPKYNKKQKPTLQMCALREKERYRPYYTYTSFYLNSSYRKIKSIKITKTVTFENKSSYLTCKWLYDETRCRATPST